MSLIRSARGAARSSRGELFVADAGGAELADDQARGMVGPGNGLAQAEARVGNYEAAVELVERVENSDMKEQFVSLIAEVRLELGTANKFMHATCETHARDE